MSSHSDKYDRWMEGLNMSEQEKQDCKMIIKAIVVNFVDRAFGMDSVQYAVQSAIFDQPTPQQEDDIL